jgi:hypothetical protein
MAPRGRGNAGLSNEELPKVAEVTLTCLAEAPPPFAIGRRITKEFPTLPDSGVEVENKGVCADAAIPHAREPINNSLVAPQKVGIHIGDLLHFLLQLEKFYT